MDKFLVYLIQNKLIYRSNDDYEESPTKPIVHRQLSERQILLNNRAEFRQHVLFSISTVLIMGILFGFFMNKARVFEPKVIRDQFRFERFIMLKMFLAAAGTSCFALTVGYFVCQDVCFIQIHCICTFVTICT